MFSQAFRSADHTHRGYHIVEMEKWLVYALSSGVSVLRHHRIATRCQRNPSTKQSSSPPSHRRSTVAATTGLRRHYSHHRDATATGSNDDNERRPSRTPLKPLRRSRHGKNKKCKRKSASLSLRLRRWRRLAVTVAGHAVANNRLLLTAIAINLRPRKTPPTAVTSSSLPPFHAVNLKNPTLLCCKNIFSNVFVILKTSNKHSLDVSLGNKPVKATAGAQPPLSPATSSRVSTLPPLFTGSIGKTSWQQLPQLHPSFPFNDQQHHHHIRRMPP
nr:hypothetical protein Iba_chr01bCG19690 [Ipomoea batatas]GMC56400.1 hypothetical protein Iba_chr01fCG6710 [Ipomoea batatas]GMC56401.1 hypothetical protein Iba_chr01fCG6720 [Ipomoea batatas]